MGFMDILSSVGKFAMEVLEQKAKEMQKDKQNFNQSYNSSSREVSQMSNTELKNKINEVKERKYSSNDYYKRRGEMKAIGDEYRKRKEQNLKK